MSELKAESVVNITRDIKSLIFKYCHDQEEFKFLKNELETVVKAINLYRLAEYLNEK